MAQKKFLDGGGVSYLWSKIISAIASKTAGFATDEELSALEAKLGRFKWAEPRNLGSISSSYTLSAFETGTITPVRVLVGAGYSGRTLKLPSGGQYFLTGSINNICAGGTTLATSSVSYSNGEQVNKSASFTGLIIRLS